jgi:hypothetical protein
MSVDSITSAKDPLLTTRFEEVTSMAFCIRRVLAFALTSSVLGSL